MLPQNWVGETIGGRYKIDSLLGQGGMSAVYRATDPNLRRMVAIKLIHTHLSVDPNFVNRFKEEAAAVARLRHPNIVQVHDFNIDGETYYMVMEYLIGETLQARLKRLNSEHRYMPYPEVIDFCTQLCQAIGYAHNHELIHRDIKPANIMLDVNGQAILMDFGIVKIIGGEYHTATGATIGTAMYMSPEQIRSERADERSDIYSLGVTLYEMISGRAPYRADSAVTLMMMVLNDPLPDLRKIRPGIPENLVAVVEKAMAKEQKDRFQSMDELGSVLQETSDQVAGLASAATVVDEEQIDVTVSPDTTVQDQVETWVDSTEVESVEDSSREELESEVTELDQPREAEVTSSIPAVQDLPGKQVSTLQQKTPVKAQETKRLNYRRVLVIAAVLLLVAATVVGYFYISFQRVPEIQLASIDQPIVPISDQTAQNVVNLGRWETNSFIEQLAYSPNSETLGTANDRDWVRFSNYRFYSGLWGVNTGILQSYQLGHNQWVNSIAFSPDGELLATASDDEKVLLWTVSDGDLVGEIESSFGAIAAVDFSPNRLLLAAGSSGSDVGLWQLSDDILLSTLRGHTDSVNDVQFSPDGQLLASASDDQTIRLWQVSDGSTIHILRGHNEPIHNLAFSPDGSLLASASHDFTVGIWQVSDGNLVSFLPGHSAPVQDVAFSPDGSLLASGSADGTLRLWRTVDGEPLHILTDDSEGITSIAFSPDGHLLVSAASDGVIRYWGLSEALLLETESPGGITPSSPQATAISPPQAIAPTSNPTNTAPVLAAVEEPGLVLWDLSHGPRRSDTGDSYDLDGMFSQLDILLEESEITLVPNLELLDQVDLDSYTVIVIAMPSATEQNYTPDEAQLIGEFVNHGGSLLILAETPGFTNRIHELENYFNVDVSQNMILDSPLQLGDHPIFEDVNKINFVFSGGSLNVRDDRAQVIASQDGMDAIVVIEDLPGKVVIIGDSNLFDNRGLADNQRFALNLFRWLQ